MQIRFSGKHMEVTPALREYATTKLQKLERFFTHVQDVHVVESITRNQHIVEVTLNADGTVIRAEERSEDMYASIDLVTDKLERQLKKFKERHEHKRGDLEGVMPAEAPVPVENEYPSILRTKKFPVKPMDPEDAALEMELVGHD
ncbi:MAG: ribosome-associated translation inhibitor RaiA, partial [bacterium]